MLLLYDLESSGSGIAAAAVCPIRAVPVLSLDRCSDARSLRGSHVPDLRARISVDSAVEFIQELPCPLSLSCSLRGPGST